MNFIQFTGDEDADYQSVLILSGYLRAKYDEWNISPNINDALNVQTNSMCIYFKQFFPTADDKMIQSMGLAFLIYLNYVANMVSITNTTTTFDPVGVD